MNIAFYDSQTESLSKESLNKTVIFFPSFQTFKSTQCFKRFGSSKPNQPVYYSTNQPSLSRIGIDIEQVPHLQFFTFQIAFVKFIGLDFNGDLFSYAETVSIQSHHLFGVVG